MEFDDVLIQLGQFGKYQKIQYILVCIPGILCAFHQLAAVFLTATPDYRCSLDSSLLNGTADTYAVQDGSHQSALMQYLNVNSSSKQGNDTDLFSGICEYQDGTTCDSFVYSQNDLTRTVVTDLDLVCSEGQLLKGTLSSSIYMAGVLLGAFIFGILSDAIGRKKTLLICIFLQGASGVACGFAPEYYSFVFLRLLVGSASMGLFMTGFVLGMELIGPKYRLVAGIVIQYFFAIGYVLLTGIAYGLKDWTYIQFAISAPSFILLIYGWLLPESARWLLSRNRVDEAEAIIQNAAKVNKVTLPKNVFGNLKQDDTPPENFIAVFKAPKLLVRSIIILVNWCVVAMGYYGLSLNSGSLGGSIFINFMLGGLVEFPGYTVCFLCYKLGRKSLHIFGMMVGGLACLGTVFVDQFATDMPEDEKTIYFVTLNMVGKFGMTIGFCIIYLWSAEIYPTSVRNSMMGLSSTFARVGSLAAPWIADLGKFIPPQYKVAMPASIFGSAVIVGALLSTALPETTGHSMPETIEEANRFPNHDRDRYGQTTTQSKADLVGEDELETEFKK